MILKFILLALFCFSFQKLVSSKLHDVDICSVLQQDGKNIESLKDKIYTNVKPVGGANAGKYSKIKADSWYQCVEECCSFERCNVAYWISSTCLHIECISDDLCQPIEIDRSEMKEYTTAYVLIRSVYSTAASLDYEDIGHDECNQTKPCPANEQCEQIKVNAQLKRNTCSCDTANDYRRINGVCRQYFSNTNLCAISYSKYSEAADEKRNIDLYEDGRCAINEECLPSSDRSRIGYCQCKIGYKRASPKEPCLPDVVGTESTSATYTNIDVVVNAGDDQAITLPKNEVNLNGHIFYASNKTEIDMSKLTENGLGTFWSLKSSTNNEKIDLSQLKNNVLNNIHIKDLPEGTYEFELKLTDKNGKIIGSDTVNVQVIPGPRVSAPLIVIISSPLTIRLPQQFVRIEARIEPSDRKVTYQWTYRGGGQVSPKLLNTNTSSLLLSRIHPGNYSFHLNVIDNLGNEQSKDVTLSATGEPIEARVTNQREIVFWPANDVTLDGSLSIVEEDTNIRWRSISNEKEYRLNDVDIVSPNSLKTIVKNLHVGHYEFELTLTSSDSKYISRKQVTVVVYQPDGGPPKANIIVETENVNILNNLITLNGQKTTADYGISEWKWFKSPNSPAMGHFINDSNRSPVAFITNLIESQYTFILEVTDDRQQKSEKSVTIEVHGAPDAENLVEILFSSSSLLHQQTLDNLIKQIRVFLIDLIPDIDIIFVGMLNENRLLIKGKNIKTDTLVSPKLIANHLQSKITSLRSASNTNILSINTYLCFLNCSGHGKCDQKTKQCVCNKHYMGNWFKSIVLKESNCEFLIHYFALATITGSTLALVFCCLCLCCCIRCRRRRSLLDRRKRIRYQLLNEYDDEGDDVSYSPNNSGEKGKGKTRTAKKNKKISNFVMSGSDDVSDENGEQTIYDKPLLTTKLRTTASIAKTRGLKVPIQDENGSPIYRSSGPSPTTTDNSMA